MQQAYNPFQSVLSNGLILLVFLLIIAGAVYKKIDVFDAFIDGAKSGFDTAIRIIPYLVGILVAVSMLRTSGAFDVVINGIKSFFSHAGCRYPVCRRPAYGLNKAIKRWRFPGYDGEHDDYLRCLILLPAGSSGILQGASDTTFYVVAVYFGSVGIKNTRYSISAMLLADLVCVVTSILLCYLFFG